MHAHVVREGRGCPSQSTPYKAHRLSRGIKPSALASGYRLSSRRQLGIGAAVGQEASSGAPVATGPGPGCETPAAGPPLLEGEDSNVIGSGVDQAEKRPETSPGDSTSLLQIPKEPVGTLTGQSGVPEPPPVPLEPDGSQASCTPAGAGEVSSSARGEGVSADAAGPWPAAVADTQGPQEGRTGEESGQAGVGEPSAQKGKKKGLKIIIPRFKIPRVRVRLADLQPAAIIDRINSWRRRGSYVPLNFKAGAEAADPFAVPAPKPAASKDPVDLGTIWGLVVLAFAYLHHSTTGYALPALLPIISPDLELTDSQGALLTVGYTLLYAIALTPVGFLADRVDRPPLLAAGLALWSGLTMAASKANGFTDLLITRVGFAAAQATQNPICFSLIPELFPRERNTAMAAYNSAIYMGRALSFAAVIVATQLGVTGTSSTPRGVTMVPLDKVDLSLVSLLYTEGNMAAITPIYDYDFSLLNGVVVESSWRQLLFWLGIPGFVIAALCLLTLDEPRNPGKAFLGDPFASSKFINPTTRALARSADDSFATKVRARLAKVAPSEPSQADEGNGLAAGVKTLLSSPAFQAVTAAAAVNDIGSWALISWQATFYQRVYDVEPAVFAPALATILPISGIIGGVGGGLIADWLVRIGGRAWLTAGATVLAAPVLAVNLLAPKYQQSLAALAVGFALSEMWRAPAAIMVRDVAPKKLGSTGSAVHLGLRNLCGCTGPIIVATLADRYGLQKAMLLVPACYLVSGVGFIFAERILSSELGARAKPPAA